MREFRKSLLCLRLRLYMICISRLRASVSAGTRSCAACVRARTSAGHILPAELKRFLRPAASLASPKKKACPSRQECGCRTAVRIRSGRNLHRRPATSPQVAAQTLTRTACPNQQTPDESKNKMPALRELHSLLNWRLRE